MDFSTERIKMLLSINQQMENKLKWIKEQLSKQNVFLILFKWVSNFFYVDDRMKVVAEITAPLIGFI